MTTFSNPLYTFYLRISTYIINNKKAFYIGYITDRDPYVIHKMSLSWLFGPGNSPDLLGVHDTRRGGTAELYERERTIVRATRRDIDGVRERER